MGKTFLDAGILIEFARAERPTASEIYDLFNDVERVFVSSHFVKLEVLPKAIYHQKWAEVSVYEQFFRLAMPWGTDCEALVAKAQEISRQHGLNAMDALHLSAAILSGCDEFITTEKPGKPMFRLSEQIRIRAIAP